MVQVAPADYTRRCHAAILDRQTAEIQIRSTRVNRFSTRGTAKTIGVACNRRGKRLSRLGHELCRKVRLWAGL